MISSFNSNWSLPGSYCIAKPSNKINIKTQTQGFSKDHQSYSFGKSEQQKRGVRQRDRLISFPVLLEAHTLWMTHPDHIIFIKTGKWDTSLPYMLQSGMNCTHYLLLCHQMILSFLEPKTNGFLYLSFQNSSCDNFLYTVPCHAVTICLRLMMPRAFLICNKFILWNQEQLLSVSPSCKVHAGSHSNQNNTKPLATRYTAALLLNTAETTVSLRARYTEKGGGEISRLKCCIQKT